jgi:hypothetical protein
MANEQKGPAFFRCKLPRDPLTAAVVQNLQEQGLLAADHSLRSGDHDIVALSAEEVELLKQAGVPVEVVGKVMPHVTDGATPTDTEVGAGLADALSTGFVTNYLDGGQITAAIAALHSSFPALTQLIDLPELTSGYDGSAAGLTGPATVKLLRLTTTPASYSKPGILILAGLHAREWAPPLAAIEFASQLLTNYAPASTDPDVMAINELVENLDILVIAGGNPDGINYSHHDEALWRKNRRVNAGFPLCPGVDNNRNFSIYWGQTGSSNDPCHYQIYRGPSSFSEVENRNIRYVVDQFPNVLTAIDCHSYGEKFLRPQPTGGTFISAEPVPVADHAIYLALEASMNSAVASVTPGKSYLTGTTSNHSGTYDEYMYFGHRIFAFDLEIGQDFQPPIADALVSVQEAAAVMRALAHETLGLSARFTTPARIVQVIDKSSSMIASGYVTVTINNAQRLIDLMGLNDATAVVSFNQTALTELPLTVITAPGIYATAHTAVSNIAFGGATSIGAGLQAALIALTPAAAPRSILLLSDGYENTLPMVATVLPDVPADVPIHTIALGAASDQALLQNMALTTGGSYFFSPDELALFEIYNVARAAAADTDMVLEDTVDAVAAADARAGGTFSRVVVVDEDTAYADFAVAAHHPGVELDVTLRAISPLFTDVSRVRRRVGRSHQVLHLRRPQPGLYELTVTARPAPARCSIAAFVNSPLRLRLGPAAAIKRGEPLDVTVGVIEREQELQRFSVTGSVFSPTTSLRLLNERGKDLPTRPIVERDDRVPPEVARALAIREALRRQTGADPLTYEPRRLHAIHPAISKAPRTLKSAVVLRAPTSDMVEGSRNIRIDVRGHARSGAPFARVGFRSVYVG